MGGSSAPTTRDQLTQGQESADRVLWRSLLGMPQGPIPQDVAKQLGLPEGTPFPFQDLFGTKGAQTPTGQYNPGMGIYTPGQPGSPEFQGGMSGWGLPGATPWLQQGSQLDPNTGLPVPEYRPVNAQMNAAWTNAANWSKELNPTQGVGESWAALQPGMQGQQSMDFKPLAGPDKLKLAALNPLPNLQLRQQRAGPDVNVPTINTPGPLNLAANHAGPQLQLPTINPAQQVGFDKAQADTSYRYNNYDQKNVAGNLGQVTDNYNFKPGQVNTTLNNKDNTQKYFQEGVMNPLLRQYDTAIKPRLADTMAAAGNSFSTRAQTAQQMALQDLQTNALGELSRVAREDEITRSQQDLAAQQFNVGTATQNAQFGGQLQQGYDLANSQRALQIAGMNQQERQFGHTADTAGQFNQANFLNQLMFQQNQQNNSNRFQAAGINNQALQFAQGLNSSNAIQGQQINNQDRQFVQGLNSNQALQQYGLNSQNALNFGSLNSNNALQSAQINNQNRQFFGNLDQQGQLAQFNANSANQLGFGQLNTQRALGAADLNNRTQLGYDTLNTNTQTGLAESAAQRQMQAAMMGNQLISSQWDRTGQQLGMGSMIQQMLQGRSDRDFQEFQRQAPENNPWIQMLMNYRGIPTNQTITGGVDKVAQGLNYAQGGIGAGVGLLTLLGML